MNADRQLLSLFMTFVIRVLYYSFEANEGYQSHPGAHALRQMYIHPSLDSNLGRAEQLTGEMLIERTISPWWICEDMTVIYEHRTVIPLFGRVWTGLYFFIFFFSMANPSPERGP